MLKTGHDREWQKSSLKGQAQNDVNFFLFLAKSAKMIIDGSETLNHWLSRVWMLLKGTGLPLSQCCLKVHCEFLLNRWVNFTRLESKVRDTFFILFFLIKVSYFLFYVVPKKSVLFVCFSLKKKKKKIKACQFYVIDTRLHSQLDRSILVRCRTWKAFEFQLSLVISSSQCLPWASLSLLF